VDTHANPDAQRDNIAPDVSVYAADNIPDADTRTDFSKMELFVELKFAESSDPFRDPKDPLRPHNPEAFPSRMIQMFLDYIVANYIHIQRLTRGLSFASTPSPYLFADDPQNSSVGIALARLLPGASITSKNRISLPTFSGVAHILTVANADTTRLSHQHRRRISSRSSMSKIVCGTPIIISFPPKYTARSPFGRATRPILAFNMETNENVFLKDYWRVGVDGMEKEGEIYALLESKGVPNIAPFGKGNDVRHHTTLTHTLRNENWACWSKVMEYRMSLNVVARLLTSFKSSREFVSAIANAMMGKTSFVDSDRTSRFHSTSTCLFRRLCPSS
jgi:hypothetical protein